MVILIDILVYVSEKVELGNDGKNIAGLDKIESKKLNNFNIRFHFSSNIKISPTFSRQKVSSFSYKRSRVEVFI